MVCGIWILGKLAPTVSGRLWDDESKPTHHRRSRQCAKNALSKPVHALVHPACRGRGDPAVRQGGEAKRRRYIVCRNEAEAKKDAADRQAVVAALEEQLKRGDKALIGNSAYRRYLRRTGK